MADRPFDYAVILAGMRTGSNLLEESLASFPEIERHGELFNPHFFGAPKKTKALGFDLAARDADPQAVVRKMAAGPGVAVFRLFQDHDPRVLRYVLEDRRAAKIVLHRRALDSYVSLKIARQTGQWWLGDGRAAKWSKVTFRADEFEAFRTDRLAYYAEIDHALKTSGQTAFHLSYDDLFEAGVFDGLGRFLGLTSEPDLTKVKARVQNPTSLAERLTNPEDAERSLAALAAPDLDASRDYEPSRGPGLRGFLAGGSVPLLYMPIRGAAHDPMADWLRRVDPGGEVLAEMTQKDLRRWWRGHPGHRAFTVLRHPLPRAWDAFCRWIMPEDGFADVRAVLIDRYGLVAPQIWDAGSARTGFKVYLGFLEANLRGQTSVRVDASWSSQRAHLAALAGFAVPDVILREDELEEGLAALCAKVGVPARAPGAFEVGGPVALGEVVDDEIEDLAERAYRRDMLAFGFTQWRQAASTRGDSVSTV